MSHSFSRLPSFLSSTPLCFFLVYTSLFSSAFPLLFLLFLPLFLSPPLPPLSLHHPPVSPQYSLLLPLSGPPFATCLLHVCVAASFTSSRSPSSALPLLLSHALSLFSLFHPLIMNVQLFLSLCLPNPAHPPSLSLLSLLFFLFLVLFFQSCSPPHLLNLNVFPFVSPSYPTPHFFFLTVLFLSTLPLFLRFLPTCLLSSPFVLQLLCLSPFFSSSLSPHLILSSSYF